MEGKGRKMQAGGEMCTRQGGQRLKRGWGKRVPVLAFLGFTLVSSFPEWLFSGGWAPARRPGTAWAHERRLQGVLYLGSKLHLSGCTQAGSPRGDAQTSGVLSTASQWHLSSQSQALAVSFQLRSSALDFHILQNIVSELIHSQRVRSPDSEA